MYEALKALGIQNDFSVQELPEGETLESEVDNSSQVILPEAKVGLAKRLLNRGRETLVGLAAGALIAYTTFFPAHDTSTLVEKTPYGELRVVVERDTNPFIGALREPEKVYTDPRIRELEDLWGDPELKKLIEEVFDGDIVYDMKSRFSLE
jgi:hypothetical protein